MKGTMTNQIIRYQPSFYADDVELTIRFPWPSVLTDQNRIIHHLSNIQWLAHNFGGVLNPEKTEWLFKFDQEEYNCVIRYLNNTKFEWKRLS